MDQVTGRERVVDDGAFAHRNAHRHALGAVRVDVDGEASGSRRCRCGGDGGVELLEQAADVVVRFGVQPGDDGPLQASQPRGPVDGAVDRDEQRDGRVVAAVGLGCGVNGEHGRSPGGVGSS